MEKSFSEITMTPRLLIISYITIECHLSLTQNKFMIQFINVSDKFKN